MLQRELYSSNTGSQYQNVQGHTSLNLEGLVLKEKEGKKRERERKERLYKTVCLLTTRTLFHACSQLVSKCQSENIVHFILITEFHWISARITMGLASLCLGKHSEILSIDYACCLFAFHPKTYARLYSRCIRSALLIRDWLHQHWTQGRPTNNFNLIIVRRRIHFDKQKHAENISLPRTLLRFAKLYSIQ